MKKRNILKKLLAFMFVLYANSTYAVFDYDRAINCGKKGNWEQAALLLNNVTADRPDVVYDKGVVAHHQKDLPTAKECFLHAACHPQADTKLCERAHFNAGNACFALKDLEGACEQYKKVLTLNSDNTFAQHNLKSVEEMLKKQQEEQKKEDKKEQDKDSNQEQQDTQQKKNGDKENQERKQSSNNGEPEKKEQQEQSESKKAQQQKEQRDEKVNKDEETGAGANNKKGQQQKQGAHGQQKKDPATHDEWLEGLLEKSDKRDAQGNKKMIKAMVQQQMGGNEGQNCW